MHPVSGPFPIASELSNPSFYKATEDERGLTMLALYVDITNDDRYQDAEGWKRFNEAAPRWVGELIRDVLSYVLSHAGGIAAVRHAIEVLTALAATDAELSDEEGIAAVLQETVPASRLNQIETDLTKHGALLAQLAEHIGVRSPR